MKTSLKKAVSSVLSACMLFSAMSNVVLADDEEYIDDIGITIAEDDVLQIPESIGAPALSDLKVGDTTISGFNKNITSYTMTVSPETKSVDITATGTEGSVVSGTGTQPIGYGTNQIIVTASDDATGAKLEYLINIIRPGTDDDYAASAAKISEFKVDFNGAVRKASITYIENAATITVPTAADEEDILPRVRIESFTVAEGTTLTYNKGEDTAVEITEGSILNLSAEGVTITATNGEDSIAYNVVIDTQGSASQAYEIMYSTAEKGYNVGETITYDVYARTPVITDITDHALDIGAVQFDTKYESSYLEFKGFEFTGGTLVQTNTDTSDSVHIAATADTAIAIPFYKNASEHYYGYAKLGTLSFKVRNNIPEKATSLDEYELSNLEITPNGYDSNDATATTINDTDAVYVHNNIAAFGNNKKDDTVTRATVSGKSYLTLNAAGMWQSNGYATEFTIPTAVAGTNYRLAADSEEEPLWKVYIGDSEEGTDYITAQLKTEIFVQDTEETVQRENIKIIPNAVYQITANYNDDDVTGGTIDDYTKTYDEGDKIVDDKSKPVPSPAPGYKFEKWEIYDEDGKKIGEITDGGNDDNDYIFDERTPSNIVIKPVFVDNDFIWNVADENNFAVVAKTTLTDTETTLDNTGNGTNSVIKHSKDITFTVTPDDNVNDHYTITRVYYKVAGNATENVVTATEGTYTVPGNAIIGNVTLYVETQQYDVITYAKGDGVEDTGFFVTEKEEENGDKTPIFASEIYAIHGKAGFYTDKECTKSITIKTAQAIATKDESATERWKTPTNEAEDEYSWTAGSTHYFSTTNENIAAIASVNEVVFNADTTLTSNAVKQYKVIFKTQEGAYFNKSITNAEYNLYEEGVIEIDNIAYAPDDYTVVYEDVEGQTEPVKKIKIGEQTYDTWTELENVIEIAKTGDPNNTKLYRADEYTKDTNGTVTIAGAGYTSADFTSFETGAVKVNGLIYVAGEYSIENVLENGEYVKKVKIGEIYYADWVELENVIKITKTGDINIDKYYEEGDYTKVEDGSISIKDRKYTAAGVETFTTETSLWFNSGTALYGTGETKNVPNVSIKDGYTDKDKGWNPALVPVSASATYTYEVVFKEFNLTFENTDAVSYTELTKITGSANPYTVKFDTDLDNSPKFKAETTGQNTLRKINYKVVTKTEKKDENNQTVIEETVHYSGTLTADSDGYYSVPANEIIADVVISAEYDSYYIITFVPDSGAILNGDIANTSIVAYQQAGLSGLYKTTDLNGTKENEFTIPTATAKTDYRLYDESADAAYWTDGTIDAELGDIEAFRYYNAVELAGKVWTNNTTVTANTVATRNITFKSPITNGTVSVTNANGDTTVYPSDADANAVPASIRVDKGTKLGDVEFFPTATPNTGYAFAGWKIKDTETILVPGSDDFKNYVLDNHTELEAVFTVLTFNWLSPDLTLSSITENSLANVSMYDVADGDKLGKVTYGESITFKLTENGDTTVIRNGNVSYSIGGGAAKAITPNDEGIYTIPGDVILGDVKLYVLGVKYVTIAFTTDDTAVIDGNSKTAYAQVGTAGLYTSVDALKASTTTDFVIPTSGKGLKAADHYRLRRDEVGGEELWGKTVGDSIALYTSNGAANELYTADTTLTARTQAIYKATFNVATGTPDNEGTIVGDTTKIVEIDNLGTDKYYYLSKDDIPKPTPKKGYQFKEWTWTKNDTNYNAESIVNQIINKDITFTAHFKIGEYDITFGDTVADFTPVSGISDDSKVTYNQDAKFTIDVKDGERLTAVKCTIEDLTNSEETEKEYTLTPENGVYTIPGENIVGKIHVWAEGVNTFNVKFETSIEKEGSVTGTTLFVKDINTRITSDELISVTVTPVTHYTFDGWYLNDAKVTDEQIKAADITADVTYVAKFIATAYDVIDVNNGVNEYISGVSDEKKAQYNYDIVFTPITTKAINSFSYTITKDGIEGERKEITMDENGQFTIPGDEIEGTVKIYANFVDGSGEDGVFVDFILRSEYKAIVNETYNKKILVLNGTNADEIYKYDGATMYYSSKYSAHVIWVDADTTAAFAATKITKDTGTLDNAYVIAYDGNINGSGNVTAADAGIINDCLHDRRLVPTSQKMLFELDWERTGTTGYNTPANWDGKTERTKTAADGNKQVTTADITKTLKKAVGLTVSDQ